MTSCVTRWTWFTKTVSTTQMYVSLFIPPNQYPRLSRLIYVSVCEIALAAAR